MNALWRVWDETPYLKIGQTNYTLKGFSIAALRSNFYIKELGIMLDAGLSGNMAATDILITHGHSDHIASLPFHLYTVKPGEKINIYVPKNIINHVYTFIESLSSLSCQCDFTTMANDTRTQDTISSTFYNLIPVTAGSFFTLDPKHKNLKIEIIDCDHSVDCVGYGLIETRLKLKEEFKSLTGIQIKKLRESGVDIHNRIEIPFFCYLGDTSEKILSNNTIEKYHTIMIECTFIMSDEIQNAIDTKHMHWLSLREYVVSHPNITFILYHFSLRYKKTEIEEFFTKENLLNVIPWISN